MAKLVNREVVKANICNSIEIFRDNIESSSFLFLMNKKANGCVFT